MIKKIKNILAKIVASGIFLGAATTSFAQKVDVVKIMSFSCPVCKASESINFSIISAVRQTGGKFVYAPVPSGEDTSGSREKVFYATRDAYPNLIEQVKNSLYKGSQDMGIPLNDHIQVYTWLQQDLAQYEPELGVIFQQAQATEANAALMRALRLAVSAGVQRLPTYIILKNGVTIAAIDPSNAKSDSLTSLRDEVIAAVKKASETN